MQEQTKQMIRSYAIIAGRYILGFLYVMTFFLILVTWSQNDQILESKAIEVDGAILTFVNIVFTMMIILCVASLLLSRKIMLYVWLFSFWIIFHYAANIADMIKIGQYFAD